MSGYPRPGNVGTIEEITSTGDTVTITDAEGPITNLEVTGGSGTVEEITSTGDTIVVTDPEGPTANVEVAIPIPVGTTGQVVTYATDDTVEGVTPNTLEGGTGISVGTAGGITTITNTGVDTFNTRVGAVVPGNADYLAVASGGLTGAVAAARFVGGTASGAPSTGTFAVGDLVVDQTGKVWVCTAAGTPGTWVQIGGASGNPLGFGEIVGPIASGYWTSLFAVGGVGTGGSAQDLPLNTLNTAIVRPFRLAYAANIQAIGVEVLTLAASSFLRIAIYNDSSGLPGTLLTDFGQLNTGSTGFVAKSSLSQALPAGQYWMACVLQGAASAQFRSCQPVGPAWPLDSNVMNGQYPQGSMPTTATVSAGFPGSLTLSHSHYGGNPAAGYYPMITVEGT